MDTLSIVGVALALGAILGGQWLEGGALGSLLQVAAFLIVVGGTLGAVMLQSPLATFLQGMRLCRWVLTPPVIDHDGAIQSIVRWADAARKEGVLSLESQVETVSDDFTRNGLQMLVDGFEPDKIRDALEIEISAYDERQRTAARVWEAAGGYAPTVGILGAVLGLIHVMENLSDPAKLGGGIAVAFVATIYGVASANLIFLPIAGKLKALIQAQVAHRELLLDGLLGIAGGENPKLIERASADISRDERAAVKLRRSREEYPNHERWLVSYADFITLLFAFFVVMYAISTLNEGKYRVLSDSLVSAFRHERIITPAGNVLAPTAQTQPPVRSMQRPGDMVRAQREQKLKGLAVKITEALRPLVQTGKVRLTQTPRGLAVEINASVLFAPAQAALQPGSIAALQAVAQVLTEVDNAVQVEGHTDNVPIATPLYPSNWELASARASSVVRLFIASGVLPSRLVAIGYADNRPVEANDAPEGRARNRRVTLLILADAARAADAGQASGDAAAP